MFGRQLLLQPARRPGSSLCGTPFPPEGAGLLPCNFKPACRPLARSSKHPGRAAGDGIAFPPDAGFSALCHSFWESKGQTEPVFFSCNLFPASEVSLLAKYLLYVLRQDSICRQGKDFFFPGSELLSPFLQDRQPLKALRCAENGRGSARILRMSLVFTSRRKDPPHSSFNLLPRPRRRSGSYLLRTNFPGVFMPPRSPSAS